MAELVDAHDSGSCVRKDVGVRVPPSAPCKIKDLLDCSTFFFAPFFLYCNHFVTISPLM